VRRSESFKASLLSILIITSLAAFLLVITAAEPIEASPGISEDFLPTDDTGISDGYPKRTYGDIYNAYVGYDDQEYNKERIYAKFDLSVVPAGKVISAKLHTYNKYAPSIGETPYTPCTLTIDAYEVENDDWLESTLDWDIAAAHHPPVGDALDTVTILNTDGQDPAKTPPEEWRWQIWDVTSYVQQEVGGDKIVTICLKSTTGEATSTDCVVWFYCKDAYESQPRMHLEVDWKGVGVEISPCEKKGSRGEDITFTVTVINETDAQDSFWLTVDSEWETDLPISVDDIPDGENREVTLTVTIPEDASLGAEDEIKVTATSKTNSSIYNFDTCFPGVPGIYPSHDAGVNSHYPDKNYGDNEDLKAGTEIENATWAQMDWRGYLMFDLSGDIPYGATINSAYLSLYTHFGGENGARQGVEDWDRYGEENVPITIYKVANDSWDESVITWNSALSNLPLEEANALFTDYIISPTDDQRYEWDITSYVNEEWGGDKKVGIGLKSGAEGNTSLFPEGVFAPFISEETTHLRCTYTTDWRPYLIVNYTELPPFHDVDVEILEPTYQENENGGTLTYTVRITNTGSGYTDTYTLDKSDDAGWTLSLPSSSGSLAPGDHVDKTLTVTIPADAENCTRDNITVTATGGGASDSDNCVAHAKVTPPGPNVEVSIPPDEERGAPGVTVTFTVTVKNTGDIEDTYDLTAEDTEDWSLSLSSSVGPLNPGDSDDVTLTVTIPSTATQCTRDTITVTATSQVDNTVSDNDSCVAHAYVGPDVSVSISPGSQTGQAGDDVTFTVTITNTGNVTDTFTLTKSNTAGWDLDLPSSSGSLDPDNSAEVTLTVTIPSTAGEGDSTTVTVTATSTENTAISASDTCTASVGPTGVGAVEVTIDPTTGSGSAGGEVTYDVTVTNTGTLTDTFSLTVSDNENWGATLQIPTTTLAAGGSRPNIKLTVTIPSDAAEGDSTTVTVIADGTHSDNSATCTATAAAAAEGISSLVYVGAAVVVVAIIAVVLVVKPF
jgi:uncharacterized membrane protein